MTPRRTDDQDTYDALYNLYVKGRAWAPEEEVK